MPTERLLGKANRMRTFADHPELPEPHGYRHAAVVEGPLIQTAGQTWTDPEPGAGSGQADLVQQTEGAVGNAVTALAGAGGGASGLVSLDVYVVGLDEASAQDVYRGIGRAARSAGFGAVLTTVLGVAALAVPGARVEVKAMGVAATETGG